MSRVRRVVVRPGLDPALRRWVEMVLRCRNVASVRSADALLTDSLLGWTISIRPASDPPDAIAPRDALVKCWRP